MAEMSSGVPFGDAPGSRGPYLGLPPRKREVGTTPRNTAGLSFEKGVSDRFEPACQVKTGFNGEGRGDGEGWWT